MIMNLLTESIEITMVAILLVLFAILYLLSFLLIKKNELSSGYYLPPVNNKAKREFEIYALNYTVVWILVFAVIIVFQLYEKFNENDYLTLCVSLALPYLLQPILYPLSAESVLPIYLRYSFKANVWIAIFSFIGNYWYTHYFYSVLKANYTFPSHRVNNVPIALFFATHFYFVTYHTFANLIQRKIISNYLPGYLRSLFYWITIFSFAYFTAFMETLTISSFPYYSFENRFMAYTLGSAFYGIYFIVSYPLFYDIDENVVSAIETKNAIVIDDSKLPYTIKRVVLEAMGAGMIVLILLDICRLSVGISLNIPGVLYYVYKH